MSDAASRRESAGRHVVAREDDVTARPSALNPPAAFVSPDRIWERVDAGDAARILRPGPAPDAGPGAARPLGERPPELDARRAAKASGIVFMLNTTAFDATVERLPKNVRMNVNDAGRPVPTTGRAGDPQTELTLPVADGSFVRFRVRRSVIFMPGAKTPQGFESFVGRGIDNPAYTTRFDRTPTGVHAIIIGPGGTFYVDPEPAAAARRNVVGADRAVGGGVAARVPHVGYRTRDRALPDGFRCEVSGPDAAGDASRAARRDIPASFTGGQKLRSYRLAMAATGEYSKFFSDDHLDPFAAVATTVNRVIAIYESELAVTFVLVANEADLIHPDAATDPYTNNAASRLLDENQTELDRVVKDANYDVGHVLSTGGGGLASLGVVCVSGRKARGETGSMEPRGDGFDVDYVAHELGHQFAANHTFNGSGGNCDGNRHAVTAFEPGSGSTIMAYAGICGVDDNLQPHSDAYFHVGSLDEITVFLGSGAGNRVGGVPTGNAAPGITAAPTVNAIPRRTPFVLTAATQPVGGADLVTYCWEEVDLGPPSRPGDDSRNSVPIFRSYPPTASPTRVFPRTRQLLDPAEPVEEWLPTRGRTLNYRVTARASYGNLGAFTVINCTVPVAPSAGPFVVTAPAAAELWRRGSSHEVTWEVAGTNAAPVNCRTVNIALTTDDGQTWTDLAINLPNNGRATVVVPDGVSDTTAARLRVSAADNIFFNVAGGTITVHD